MKIEDISKVLGNIDERHVKEAMNYKPKHNRSARWIALAACIAVIVTSIPLAFILNREDASEDGDVHQETHNHEENIEDVLKGYGNLQLSNGSLNLNVIQLSDGKIDKDTDTTVYDKYVHEYTPMDARTVFEDMVAKALPYYGLTELENDMGVPHTYIKNTRYSVTSYDDVVTRRIYAAHSTFTASHFVNEQISKQYESGTIKFPTEDDSQKIFEMFADQIELINDLLVTDLDRCFVTPANSSTQRTVYFWNSSNEALNKEYDEIAKIMENDKYDYYHVGVSTTFRTRSIQIDFTLDENGCVEKISTQNIDPPHQIEYEKYEREILDFLALEITEKYFCISNDESFLQCAFELEPFLKDVFSIEGFENKYDSEVRAPVSKDDFCYRSSFGVTKVAKLAVSITPTPDHASDVVMFTFYSIDGETFFLGEIKYEYCVAGDSYINLIDYEKAVEQLVAGYGIGDIGQGCYICREKYRAEIIEYIKNNTTYELIVLPDIVFEIEEGEILYDLPFYKFTTKPDENGKACVSYVIAIDYGYNVKFDLTELNKTTYEYNLSMCLSAADHGKIEIEKTKRTEELRDAYVEEYLEANPEAKKAVVVKLAAEKFRW